MKQFNITVNGKSYVVDVEEVKAESSVVKPAAPVQAAKPAAAPVSAPKPQPATPAPTAGAGGVKAPMPGTIFDIKVTQGQQVAAGEVLIILEAMKMENEIMAPTAGVVQSIHVTKGSSVNTGDVLVVVE